MQKRLALIGAGTLMISALGLAGAAAQRKPAAVPVVVYKSPT
jgi:hypothetical protein